MNPQLMALMALLSGQGGQQQPQQGTGLPDNSDIMNALRGPSPVNTNPVYGSTVNRFYGQNPIAGTQPFTGAGPLQAGPAGNNAMRGGMGHSSFMPTDFSSSMQKWTG